MAYIITENHLAAIAGKSTPLMEELADWINKICSSYEIDMPKEYAHFLAQACHETDRFRTRHEYASGNAYEGREDLGYLKKGDGPRSKAGEFSKPQGVPIICN